MRAFLVFLLVLIWFPAVSQELSASVDRTTVFEGETLRLTVTHSGGAGAQQPDFSVLEPAFYVSDLSTSSQFNLVNGRRSTSISWSVLLEPKQVGTIVIPALEVAGQQTRPVSITVKPRPQSSGTERDIFLEMAASPLDPYVHSQVLITLKLFHVDALTEGRIFEPDITDAVVERLGEDVAYTATLDGTRYRVLERRFAVFPERSGELQIPAATFRGRVADSRSGFNSIFDRGRRVSVSSRSLSLDVLPVPQSAAGSPWIPARSLEIQEFWPEGGASFVVGEPATRTLRIRAKGLLAPQLPEIQVPDSDAFKVYPDQAKTQSTVDAEKDWVYASLEQSYAMVPTRSGNLTLPEIRIPWWNTETDSIEYAVVPAREIIVQPSSRPVASEPSAVTSASAVEGTNSTSGVPASRWLPLGFWAMTVLWLMTVLGWLWDRRLRSRPHRSRQVEKTEGHHAVKRKLREACLSSNASDAARLCLQYARMEHPGRALGGLRELAASVASVELSQALLDLDRFLYAPGNDRWEGEQLWVHIDNGIALQYGEVAASENGAGALPPLYSR